MAGTIVVDRIESDSSYTSTINVASKVNFTGGMQVGGQDSTFGGMRNRIINGAMVIDQRYGGASAAMPDGALATAYGIDRWAGYRVGTTTATLQQSTDVPSGQGFVNSFVYTNGTGVTPGSNASAGVYQRIEGYNISDLMWGTADAKPITISFWVKSSLTGTFTVALINAAYSRSYPATYTINQANTWEYKTITVPGCIDGQWPTTNGNSLAVNFDMGSGSNFLAAANTWSNNYYSGATGAVKLCQTTGATMSVTGVQLEKGSVATTYEHRMYATELAMCQRYYWQINGSNGNQTGFNVSWYSSKARIGIPVPVPMRGSPSVTLTGTTSGAFFTTNDDSTYINFQFVSAYGERNGDGHTAVGLNFNAGTTGPGGGILYIQSSRVLSISAEL
jgi:hypothetical protein